MTDQSEREREIRQLLRRPTACHARMLELLGAARDLLALLDQARAERDQARADAVGAWELLEQTDSWMGVKVPDSIAAYREVLQRSTQASTSDSECQS